MESVLSHSLTEMAHAAINQKLILQDVGYKPNGESYRQIATSIFYQKISAEKATEFLQIRLTKGSVKWIKQISEWTNNK